MNGFMGRPTGLPVAVSHACTIVFPQLRAVRKRLASGLKSTEVKEAVLGKNSQLVAARLPDERADLQGKAHLADQPSALAVPETDRAVVATGRNPLAVGMKGDGGDRLIGMRQDQGQGV